MKKFLYISILFYIVCAVTMHASSSSASSSDTGKSNKSSKESKASARVAPNVSLSSGRGLLSRARTAASLSSSQAANRNRKTSCAQTNKTSSVPSASLK
jgi:hypothetical protein